MLSPEADDDSLPYRAYRILVKGTVQGVGFRPFVYRIAVAGGLRGSVANNSSGVVIQVVGTQPAIDRFLSQLADFTPPLASIDSIDIAESDDLGATDFRIVTSSSGSRTEVLVPVDVTICPECEKELFDPADRRYQYPLNNCTNCGPRYTIIRDLPYDRAATAMSPFPFCSECRKDYEDPANRRFHAEATGCPVCGPRLQLTTAVGEPLATDNPVVRAAEMIRQGRIVAVQGVGGFHILCDAGNDSAIARLRQRKQRPDKPFAVMVKDPALAQHCGLMDDHSMNLLTSPQRPVVLVPDLGRVSPLVNQGLDRIGLFLPYSPLHLLLLQHLECPLIATSANISDEPIIITEPALRERLGGVFDAVLSLNREIVNGCDDSVVTTAGGVTLMLRRARGYAPAAIKLPLPLQRRVLAVGADLKSTIALGFDRQAILSPHIGDLGAVAAEEYFHRTIAGFRRLYDFTPELILCDKHPGYFSSSWARRQSLPVHQVQHHHAHALAAMVACRMGAETEMLAFCWDGTGYGDDGTLWGGEVLCCSYRDYQRRYQLRPLLLLGGEQAIREPRRVALSLLFDLFGADAYALENPCLQAFSDDERQLLYRMYQQRLNSPFSSSVGRLFDGVASLLGICQKMTYEGQSGMLMEKYYDSSSDLCYRFAIDDDVIDLLPTMAALVEEKDRVRGVTGFINTLVEVVLTVMEREQRREAVLTGGVFQNSRLVEALLKQAQKRDLQLHLPQNVPVNDGGIALGQVAAALAL